MNNGGPAFPKPAGHNGLTSIDEHRGNEPEDGMSLRDYFAAKAMHAELVTNGVPGEACEALIEAAEKANRSPEDQMAFNAYEMADAMLRAKTIK